MQNLFITGYRAHELQILVRSMRVSLTLKSHRLPPYTSCGRWLGMGAYSGQYGVDLWACEVVLELKQSYPHLEAVNYHCFSEPGGTMERRQAGVLPFHSVWSGLLWCN